MMLRVLLKEKERVCYDIVVLKSYFRCILIDQLVCVVFFLSKYFENSFKFILNRLPRLPKVAKIAF